MATIQWSDDLSVHIPSIDRQHQTLIKLINKLDEAIRNDNGKMVLKVILTELTRYTQVHFIYEEALFDMHGYTESENHKKAHEKLFERVEYFNKELNKHHDDIYDELLAFLNDWLYSHILKQDMAYSKHLVDHGAE